MSANVKIPSTYTIKLTEIDAIDVSASLTGNPSAPIATSLTGDKQKPIATHLTGDEDNPIATLITGDPDQPVALEMLNIPRLSLDDIKDLLTPKFRMRFPNYEQICLNILGIEVLSVCFSGEIQAIAGPNVPNRFERCEIDCPDLDTREFPKETPVHKEG